MTVRFVPATARGWIALVHGPRALALVGSVGDRLTEPAWDAIRAPDGFQAVLELLTGQGLAATPEFVLVEWEAGEDARVILRGPASIQVVDATGSQSLAAAGVSTWVERTLTAPTSLSIALPGAVPTGAPLPLESGVALAASLEFGVPESSAQDVAAPAAAEPDATPAEAASTDATPTDAVPEATLADLEPVTETVHRSAVAAETAKPDAQTTTDSAPVDAGDHDGQTIVVRDVAKLRGGLRGRAKAPASPPPAAPLVLVVSTTGARELLDQPILVGRSPTASKVSGAQLPRLVTVGGADQDISRTHAHFAVEGGTVVVTDLHSKNGTSIVLPGKDPQKLRAGEPTTVLVGTVVDLGGGLTFTVEEEPVTVAGKKQ